MADGYVVDPAVLEQLSSSLRTAGGTLDGVGKGMPGAPDAGELSGDMGDLIARLVESTGELVVGMGGAGDDIAAARTTYTNVEDGGRETFDAGVR
jgi:hypothetical protein